MKGSFAALAASIVLTFGAAQAETVLRMDEGGIGELDPHKASDLADSILLYNVYDTLVFPAVDQGTNEYRPHLAEKIDLDATGLIYTVTLRSGVKFHSGNVLEAEDVVFSMNRMLALNKGFAYLFRGWVDSTTAKDARTVVIKLAKPYTAFYASLARLGIVDRKTVMAKKEAGPNGELGDYGEKFLNTNDAGTGAYRVDYHKPDELTVMKKTGTYFGFVNKAAPDTARMAYVIKEPTLLTLMSRGEHDIVNTFVTPETKKALSQVKGVTLLREPGIAQYFIKMNNKRAPTDDVNCRRAFAYSIDYQALHQIAEISPEIAAAKPANGPLLATMAGYDTSLPMYAKRDMERAKAELAKCKYKAADSPIEIMFSADNVIMERYALLMQQNWSELGFKADVARMPWNLWLTKLAKPETAPNFAQVFSNARTPDPDSFLYNIYHSSQHGQFSAAEFFSDAEVDRMLDEGRSMPLGAARTELYKKISRRIVDLQPSIFGFQLVNLYPTRQSVSIPTLENPNLNTGLMGGNMLYRVMEMKAAN